MSYHNTPARFENSSSITQRFLPGESIGATEFYEGARVVEPGFEPLEDAAPSAARRPSSSGFKSRRVHLCLICYFQAFQNL